MNTLTYGFELAFIGFSMVLITLFILAMILKLFNRFLSPPVKREKAAPFHAEKAMDEVLPEEKETEGATTLLDASGTVRPEVAAAISGAIMSYLAESAEEQYPVTAAIAAVRYAMPAGAVSFHEAGMIDLRKIGAYSKWAQVGRKRLLHRRQDTALLRRRKLR